MKPNIIVLVLLIISTLLTTCKKQEAPLNIPETMSMSVNGTAITTTGVNAVYNLPLNTLGITANFPGNSSLSIVVPNPKVGSFDVSTSGVQVTYTPEFTSIDVFNANAGTLNITMMANGALTGNFTFTVRSTNGQKTDQISAGTFTTTYTTQQL